MARIGHALATLLAVAAVIPRQVVCARETGKVSLQEKVIALPS
jgi:hypothetical protein